MPGAINLACGVILMQWLPGSGGTKVKTGALARQVFMGIPIAVFFINLVASISTAGIVRWYFNQGVPLKLLVIGLAGCADRIKGDRVVNDRLLLSISTCIMKIMKYKTGKTHELFELAELARSRSIRPTTLGQA